MKAKKPTARQIRNLCTGESFEQGRHYYEQGMVASPRISDTVVIARVGSVTPNRRPDGSLPTGGTVVISLVGRGAGGVKNAERVRAPDTGHVVAAPLGSCDREHRCTCPYDGKGACSHAVAVLLYASDNFERMAKDAKRRTSLIGVSLEGIVNEQLRDFLMSEMKRDEGLWKRFLARVETGVIRDYRAEIDAAYAKDGDRWGYRGGVNLSEFFMAAKANERCRNLAEAGRIYVDMADAIYANIVLSYSHGERYDDYEKAIIGLVSCTIRQDRGSRGRRRCISYLLGMVAKAKIDDVVGICEDALCAVCPDRQDLEYLRDLLDQLVPDTGSPDRHSLHSRKTTRLLRMQADVLGRLGDEGQDAFCAKYYRYDPDICMRYLKILNESDPDRAMQVIEEGGRLFPHIDIAMAAAGLYPRSDPRRLDLLKRIFYKKMDHRYYRMLRDESNDWPGMAKSIAADLRKAGRFDALVAALLAVGAYGRAVTEAVSCGSLEVLALHHGYLCPRYPERYYAAYKSLLEDFDITASSDGHKKFARYLKMMKSVPGHEEAFAGFVASVMDRYRRRPALLKEIKAALMPSRAAV